MLSSSTSDSVGKNDFSYLMRSWIDRVNNKPSLIVMLVLVMVLYMPCLSLSDENADLIKPDNSFILSEQEAQFIKSLAPLRVMIDDNFVPLSTYDKKTRTNQGISVDLFRHIADKLGLKFQLLHDPKLSWSNKVELFNKREVDLLMPVSFTAERAKAGIFTTSFYDTYYGVIGNKSRNIKIKNTSELAAYKVGVTKASAIIPFIQPFVPPSQIIYFDNQSDLYKALQNNQVDVALQNKNVFMEDRFNLGFIDLAMLHTIVESPRKYSYYLNRTEEFQNLTAIIDRYLAGLDYSMLVTRYERGEDELILRYAEQKQQKKLLVIGIFCVLAILALLGTAYLKHRRLTIILTASLDQVQQQQEELRGKNADLQQSEAKFRRYIDSSPIGVFVADEAGHYLEVNPTGAAMTGYSKSELMNMHIPDLIPRESIVTALKAFLTVKSTGSSADEMMYLTKDGNKRWWTVDAVKLSDNRFLGFARDINERKQIEMALLKSERNFRSIIELTPVPLAINDEDGNITYLNKAFLQAVGYTTDDIPNVDNLWPLACPDEQYRQSVVDCWQRNSEEASRSGCPFSPMEINVVCKDNSLRTFICSATSLEENFSGSQLVIFYDISDRKRAESDLRIAATAFESQEGMVVTDANGLILRVNRAFTQISGYTEEEVVGQNPRILKSGRHNSDFYRTMWESINLTGGWQGEIWDRRKNGKEYPKWLTISSVKDESGTVTNYIGAHFDITERKQAEEKINRLAFYDQMTGLPNRTLLLDRLRQTMSSSSRTGSYGALLFIDLDNFKTLNDTLGHDMGDLLLQQVAHRLTTCVRAEDTTARLGGDEFVLMLASLSLDERTAASQTETVAGKILAVLNQPYQLKDVTYHITPSIGATLFSGNLTEMEDLLKQADIAMYRSKDAGRNTIRFFDPAMETVVKTRAALEKDLRVAVQKRQFQLHYQAQMVGGQLTGSEALVRWHHPQRGMVSPAEFIPMAEETGLILFLGQWVLETACAQLAIWAAHPEMEHLTVAVNVSARQFHQADFVNQVLEILQITGANPKRLKLELTESMLISNVEEIIEKMFALKAMGVGFSLDDFGTGYSSLSYLKRLPLDQLKIDQSFVRDVLIDPNDAAIAKTIIALAQNLGLGVIAEGVETAEQRDFLASSGCHVYQGYYFSRPLPIEGFEEFARKT